MKKSVFLKTYIHKSGIEPGYKFFYFAQVQISYRKAGIVFFTMKLNKFLVFKQSNLYTLRSSIYNKFFVQFTSAFVCHVPVKTVVDFRKGLLIGYTGLLWGK